MKGGSRFAKGLHCGIRDNSAVSQGVHLIIPHASCASPGCRDAVAQLRLPRLSRLLSRMADAGTDGGQPDDLSPPHERVLARHLGLWRGDGRTPWAAWDLRQAGGEPGGAAFAWLTPCHWQVGRDRILMGDPEALQLSESHSRALLAAMQPYFEEDGLSLEWVAPLRWRAQGPLLGDLACASLDRVIGSSVDAWLPRSPQAGTLRRLQQEMQMLLYTHPVSDERQAAGLAPVNSFWISGAGVLPPGRAEDSPVRLEDSLRPAALQGNATGWAEAWSRLDAQAVPPLQAALDRGEPVRITLCGEAAARSWTGAPPGWGDRLRRLLRPVPSPANILESL
jgi:hypothetical protein